MITEDLIYTPANNMPPKPILKVSNELHLVFLAFWTSSSSNILKQNISVLQHVVPLSSAEGYFQCLRLTLSNGSSGLGYSSLEDMM
jgi:hypothetical protein